MGRFQGKAVFVTGAASGIGRATAVRFAAEGASVTGVDLNAAGLADTEAEAKGSDGTLVTQPLDVSDTAALQGAIGDAVERFDGLDVLANIAGILRFGHSHEFSVDTWNQMLAVNLTATFVAARSAIPHLLERRGVVVNIASTAAHAGCPWGAAYSASKGGVLALTRALAVEYAGQGLRVVSISPGSVDTPIQNEFAVPEGANAKLVYRMMPLGPYASPEQLAGVITWAASPDSATFNGADVRIDSATLA